MPRNVVNNEFDYLYEIGDFGLEIEISDINRFSGQFSNELNVLLPGYKRAHDASCETPVYSLFGIPTVTTSNKETGKLCMFMREETLGGEIVSPIIPSSECWSKDIRSLTDLLFRYGETNVSNRDSMHIHINVGKAVGLETMKNLLHFSATYEAILYRLGGLGRENRGEENSYIYQRPYLGNSPPVILQNNSQRYPILVYEDLMEAETKAQFFDRLGDTTHYAGRGTRYVTQRYFGVNFYSIPIYGTIEFRTMNKTLNPDWIIAWIAFCRAIVKKAVYGIKSSVDNKYRPLYENREISMSEFTSVLDSLPLDTETIKVLREIWKESPTPMYDNKWRYSHLKEPTYFYTGRYMPTPIKSNVYQPKVIEMRDINLKSLDNFYGVGLDVFDYHDGRLRNRNDRLLDWKQSFRQAINDNDIWHFGNMPVNQVCSLEHEDEYNITLYRTEKIAEISIDDYNINTSYTHTLFFNSESNLHIGKTLRLNRLLTALYDGNLEDFGFDTHIMEE